MQPLLEAMKMDVTVSLDWKCQGSPFAHHLTQLIRSCGLPTFSEPVSQPGLPEIDLTDAMSPGDWSLRSCEGTVPGKLARRFSGSRGLKRAVKLTMMAVGAQGAILLPYVCEWVFFLRHFVLFFPFLCTTFQLFPCCYPTHYLFGVCWCIHDGTIQDLVTKDCPRR